MGWWTSSDVSARGGWSRARPVGCVDVLASLRGWWFRACGPVVRPGCGWVLIATPAALFSGAPQGSAGRVQVGGRGCRSTAADVLPERGFWVRTGAGTCPVHRAGGESGSGTASTHGNGAVLVRGGVMAAFTVRVPDGPHARFEAKAAIDRRSVNAEIVDWPEAVPGGLADAGFASRCPP